MDTRAVVRVTVTDLRAATFCERFVRPYLEAWGEEQENERALHESTRLALTLQSRRSWPAFSADNAPVHSATLPLLAVEGPNNRIVRRYLMGLYRKFVLDAEGRICKKTPTGPGKVAVFPDTDVLKLLRGGAADRAEAFVARFREPALLANKVGMKDLVHTIARSLDSTYVLANRSSGFASRGRLRVHKALAQAVEARRAAAAAQAAAAAEAAAPVLPREARQSVKTEPRRTALAPGPELPAKRRPCARGAEAPARSPPPLDEPQSGGDSPPRWVAGGSGPEQGGRPETDAVEAEPACGSPEPVPHGARDLCKLLEGGARPLSAGGHPSAFTAVVAQQKRACVRG